MTTAGAGIELGPRTVSLSHSAAGPSDLSRVANPQLGPQPWFAYPSPTSTQLEEELPPYWDAESIPLGHLLDRLSRKGYGDMGTLLQQTLPISPLNEKPRHIIDFARTQRQAVLKYLAILRWKMTVDVPVAGPSSQPAQIANGYPSFPTPHSSAESNNTSPAAGYVGHSAKGKGKAIEEELDQSAGGPRFGKVTDAKRVAQFMEHQNLQHGMTVDHVKHVTRMIETLRERNPDLLTAVSLLSLGTYISLPTEITETHKPPSPLTNRSILRLLRRLNRHLQYRLKCVDCLPSEMTVTAVENGKAYVKGGGEFGWTAQLTVVGFGDARDPEESRWWLTGIDWGWRESSGVGDESKPLPKLSTEDRDQTLETVNREVLTPRSTQNTETNDENKDDGDAPLVRLYNFLEHLSLSYQLETLFTQAMALSQGRWRGQLLVELDRKARKLRVRYWVRRRPAQQSQASQQGPGKRVNQSNTGQQWEPLTGGTIHISISDAGRPSAKASLLEQTLPAYLRPKERVVNKTFSVQWEIGEIGAGPGYKAGDTMDPVDLKINPGAVSMSHILTTATRTHAAHLTRLISTPLLSSARLAVLPLTPPYLDESSADNDEVPLALRIPLPSKQRPTALVVGISALTGLINIEDEGATEARTARALMACAAINDQRSRLQDDLGRLIVAVITEGLESQMRQLGWAPTRRLPLRTQDLAANDLQPASTIYVPLPTSELHLLVAKVTTQGIVFELLKLSKVPADNGIGVKTAVGDRSPMDLTRLRMRRLNREQNTDSSADATPGVVLNLTSTFEIDNRDLRDAYIFCNALVAQNLVEQQLKDRAIPYNLQYPPTSGPGAAKSSSTVAGMVPTIVVNADDLLKDGRAADVAFPSVYIQIKDWWKGGKCHVMTVVRLRHKPALTSNGASPSTASQVISTAKAEGITFDQANSVVRFQASDIARCVPSFLEQWERLSKVIVVAGEVNRLNKSAAFQNLKMLSFDLRTATFSYATGHIAAITYTPQDDSYDVSFSCDNDQENPHDKIAGLLSHRLNELTRIATSVKGESKRTGIVFMSLIRDTLPFLQEAEQLRSGGKYPTLVYRSVSDFRLVWDVERTKRYAIDFTLIQLDRFLIRDASKSGDASCGPITSIPDMVDVIGKTYQIVQMARNISSDVKGAYNFASSPLSSMNGGESAKPQQEVPEMMRLDNGSSMICSVKVIRDVVRTMAEEVKAQLGPNTKQ